MSATGTRVFWKPMEREMFFAHAARIWPSCGNSLDSCARQAMALMPADRRRPIWAPLMTEMHKEIKKRAKAEAKEVAAAPSPLPPEPRRLMTLDEQWVAEAVTHSYVQGPPPTVQDSVVGWLVDVVERTLTHPATILAARTFVKAAFAREAAEAAVAPAWPESPAFARKKRVLVVGPNADLFAELERIAADRVVLRLWNQDKSFHQLKETAAGSHAVYLLTTRVSHKVPQSLDARGVPYKLVNSNEELRQMIEKEAAT